MTTAEMVGRVLGYVLAALVILIVFGLLVMGAAAIWRAVL